MISGVSEGEQSGTESAKPLRLPHVALLFSSECLMFYFRFPFLTVVSFVSLVSLLNPSDSLAETKNVLFIISDDLKASVLGCYGDKVCKTPNIDRLAARGMLFNRAYCQGTSCAPSRQSFMFSRYQGREGMNMAEYFRTKGWYTARVGKIYHMRVPGDIIAGTNGLDVASSWTERFNSPGLEAHTPGDYACLNLNIFTRSLVNRESTKMKHRMFVTVQYEGDGSDQADHKSATKALQLLNDHKDEPFFLAVGFVRPHYPMVAPHQYFEPYPWQKMEMPPTIENDLADIPKLGVAGTVSTTNSIGKYPDNQKRMWSGYYASVQFMDDQVGRLLDELDRLGLSESTTVVFTSDHGYHLGEHGFWQKSNLHEQVLRVPLIVSAPGKPAGKSDSIVELMDVYPTLTQLAGLEIPDSVQGKSLVPILDDPMATVKNGALSFNKGHSLRTPDWHYMRYTDGSKELYKMSTDSNEFTNLAGEEQYAGTIGKLDQQLDSTLESFNLEKRSSMRKNRKKDSRTDTLQPSQSKQLFNGKDLSGWKGRKDLWSVEDGQIVGRTSDDDPIQGNSFLIYEGGEPGNFELVVWFKIKAGNSGIQYRSHIVDEKRFFVGGYQADIDASNHFAGILYEERGRGILAQRGENVTIENDGRQTKLRFADSAKLGNGIHAGKWNEYRIVAEDNRLRHYVNHSLTAEVIDKQTEKSASKGVIAFQLHQGPAMEVRFKNISLRSLK